MSWVPIDRDVQNRVGQAAELHLPEEREPGRDVRVQAVAHGGQVLEHHREEEDGQREEQRAQREQQPPARLTRVHLDAVRRERRLLG